MGLGNGNPKSGDLGSNWRYEYQVLKALNAIANNTGSTTGPIAETPSMVRATGAGLVTIPQGYKSVSFYNAGNADANVQGGVLKQGEMVSFAASGNNYLTAITYNPLTSTLLVTKLI